MDETERVSMAVDDLNLEPIDSASRPPVFIFVQNFPYWVGTQRVDSIRHRLIEILRIIIIESISSFSGVHDDSIMHHVLFFQQFEVVCLVFFGDLHLGDVGDAGVVVIDVAKDAVQFLTTGDMLELYAFPFLFGVGFRETGIILV